MTCFQCGLTREQAPTMAWHRHRAGDAVWCWPCLRAKACPCFTDAERQTVARDGAANHFPDAGKKVAGPRSGQMEMGW